jgi:hypothetical protein
MIPDKWKERVIRLGRKMCFTERKFAACVVVILESNLQRKDPLKEIEQETDKVI